MSNEKRILYIMSILLLIMISIITLYYSAKGSPHTKNDIFKLYGTYQFNMHTLDGDYLAIIPPSNDDQSNEGQFEWYNNRKHEMLLQGTYKINNKGILSLYVNKKNIGILVVIDKSYYFINDSLEPQKIKKTSPIATLYTP